MEWSGKSEAERELFVEGIRRGWRSLESLGEEDAVLAAYAEKLTRTPAAMGESDVTSLREVGLDDVAIHDAIQVISYFNYINRIADAVDVELEPEYPPHPREGRQGGAS